MDGSPQLTIVVPTRNRAFLAFETIKSVFDEASLMPGCFRLLISDNSSDLVEQRRLEAFVNGFAQRSSSALDWCLVRTGGEFDMSSHWGWALSRPEALQGSHVLVLTDREVVNLNGLKALHASLTEHPSHVVSFPTADSLDDRTRPLILTRYRRSGTTALVSTRRLIQLTAEAIITDALPRLLNSAVPTELITRVLAGGPLATTAPDFNVCFRLLAEVDAIRFLDESIVTFQGLSRSNGLSTTTGVLSPDAQDFLAYESRLERWDPLRFGSDILTTDRIVLDEYRHAAQKDSRFPAYSEAAFTRLFAMETANFPEGELRSRNMEALARHGLHLTPLSERRIRALSRFARMRRLGPVSYAGRARYTLRDAEVREFESPEPALAFVRSAAPYRSRDRLHLRYLTSV